MNSRKDLFNENLESPFERILKRVLAEPHHLTQNDFPVEHFAILFDSFIHYFYKKKKRNRSALELLTDFDGVKPIFEKNILFPYLKKDRSRQNYKIIVLPDNGDNREKKEIRVREAIKDYDCLENLQIYELILRLIQSYSELELIEFVKKHDPHIQRNKAPLFKWLERRAEIKLKS